MVSHFGRRILFLHTTTTNPLLSFHNDPGLVVRAFAYASHRLRMLRFSHLRPTRTQSLTDPDTHANGDSTRTTHGQSAL